MTQPPNPEAQRLMQEARAAAQALHMPYISTEHVLLACIENSSKILTRLFDRLGIHGGMLRQIVLARAPRGAEVVPDGQLPVTPSVKRVLETSLEEAGRLRHTRIDAAHVFLGLVADEGIAGEVLRDAGIDLRTARGAIARECEVNGDPGERHE